MRLHTRKSDCYFKKKKIGHLIGKEWRISGHRPMDNLNLWQNLQSSYDGCCKEGFGILQAAPPSELLVKYIYI